MSSKSASLPDGWTAVESSSHPGKIYFYNTVTGETTWDMPTTPASGTDSGQVRASHLLVKHKGSRNPSSWKNPKITITKEEAIAQLEAHRARIASGEVKFADLAAQESDCSSAKRGGDLGLFTRDVMQKPFSDAAFALKVGQLSGVVDTASGVHIILRTA